MKPKWEDIKEPIDIETKKMFNIELTQFINEYNKTDINNIAETIKESDLTVFIEEVEKLRGLKRIKLPPDLLSCTIEEMIEKYNIIRNSINTVLDLKSKFNMFKANWKTLEQLLNFSFNHKKEEMMVEEDIKSLKNQELRSAEINYRLKSLVYCIEKIDLINIQVKAFDAEINETLDYLKEINKDISRIQSAIELALDTGELLPVYWRKKSE